MAHEDDFDAICKRVEGMIQESRVPLRCTRSADADILYIHGVGASPLDRARYGLEYIEEMAYTAAEHHPYYKLLNGVVDAARILLDRWNDTISAEDADNLRWSLACAMECLDGKR